LNPWLATTDLFSSPVAATFGALILFMAYTETEMAGELLQTSIQQKTGELRQRVIDPLRRGLRGRAYQCGDDICLDVNIRFDSDRDAVLRVYERGLRQAAQAVRESLAPLDRDWRQCVEITIEGHTDQRAPSKIANERERFLYNWRLSSRRASSVLYLFRQEGVAAPHYRILALGYADSMRLANCDPDDDPCNHRNRRTTFRIRIDTRRVEELLAH
jgi:outer membrane protein OmpA-like peptidoglycan-associated protein